MTYIDAVGQKKKTIPLQITLSGPPPVYHFSEHRSGIPVVPKSLPFPVPACSQIPNRCLPVDSAGSSPDVRQISWINPQYPTNNPADNPADIWQIQLKGRDLGLEFGTGIWERWEFQLWADIIY